MNEAYSEGIKYHYCLYVYILFMLFLQLIPIANSVTPPTPNYLYSSQSLLKGKDQTTNLRIIYSLDGRSDNTLGILSLRWDQ